MLSFIEAKNENICQLSLQAEADFEVMYKFYKQNLNQD